MAAPYIGILIAPNKDKIARYIAVLTASSNGRMFIYNWLLKSPTLIVFDSPFCKIPLRICYRIDINFMNQVYLRRRNKTLELFVTHFKVYCMMYS